MTVLNLTENYRSHPDIIHTAHGIADQIESRLHKQLDDIVIDKTLTASSKELPEDSTIERHEFAGIANEYSWVSNRIAELIKSGVQPHEIAVLAPQHRYLEGLVPFLATLKLPISYEKRENILETPLVRIFRTMCELVTACEENDTKKMNELFPRVLSLDFYQIPVVDIWRINWQMKQSEPQSWAELALENQSLAPHVLFFLSLGIRSSQQPLEYVLDYGQYTIIYRRIVVVCQPTTKLLFQ